MTTVLLMGVGTNNWLGYLWLLLGMAAIVQSVDWVISFIKRRRLRKIEEQQLMNSSVMPDGAGFDFPENETVA